MMGLYKELRPWSKLWRGAKTLFFLLNMLASLLLVCAPPLLIVLLDVLVPSATLLSSSSSSIPPISSQLKTYRFDTSLLDVPLVSIARSLLILCAYVIWEGRGPYLGIASVCSFVSIGFVSAKAATMFGMGCTEAGGRGRHLLAIGVKEGAAIEALFLCSLGLAVAHVLVAYRTTCRERRKLLVYRIDIEAVKLKDIRL
ncbi:uncharacterized protein M6B38_168945 [Iris pallida]|uniref:MENTAL domain-containing protein n=1 Tax=Iris pallida TaxID=29817 RepID=A0AAX6EW74_IRIPA|nr:uncharacterized protein M6B38_168945 [Iris pallida]